MSTERRAARGARSASAAGAARFLAAVLLPLAAVLALALAAGAPARADDDPDGASDAGSAGQRIADGLRTSPVYVDPAYRSAFPPDEQRRLVAKIKASGLPVRVVVVPLISGDAWGGDPEKMVDVVRYRMAEGAQKKAVYMTLSTNEGYLDGFEFPRDGQYQAFWGVAAVGHQDDMKGRSLYAKFSRALEIVRSGDGEKQYEKATADLHDDDPAERDSAADGGGADDSAGDGGGADDGGGDGGGADDSGADAGPSPLLLGVLIGSAVAVLAAAVLGFRTVRWRARTSARAPFTSPRSVFATARTAGVRDLRKRAQRELLAYNEKLIAHEPGEHADSDLLQLSLDAYAAACTVLDEARDTPDLAGVLALLHEGRDALERSEPAPRSRRKARAAAPTLPLCFFDPLHGAAAERIRWRPLGRREALRVAACRECSAAVSARRVPEVLTHKHDGRRIPYFEVPPEHSLWAATGYGSLTEEPLTGRVLRGDFTRTTRTTRTKRSRRGR
ncbi:hypothetical protein [Streptomyces sp. NPDC006925]|uniref:hypothetical protein n=1 Tax=Streptomyces sp. NPDC006925 TaxID=3364768 RepID=UPI0036897B0E